MDNSFKKHLLKEYEKIEEKFKNDVDLTVYEDFKPIFIKMTEIWKNEGHTGFSAHFFAARLKRLVDTALLYKPFLPFENEEDLEFQKIGKDTIQSMAYPSIFKDPDTGEIYDIDGIYFIEGDHSFSGYINIKGFGKIRSIPVRFPYYPESTGIKIRLIDKNESLYECVDECEEKKLRDLLYGKSTTKV